MVLQVKFRDILLKYLHDDVDHQGQDRTLSLVRSRFFGPVLRRVSKIRLGTVKDA